MVLLPVEPHVGEFPTGRPLHPGEILVGFQAGVDLEIFQVFPIVDVERDEGVLLPGLRVLVAVLGGVECLTVDRHGVLAHIAFVPSEVGQVAAIGAPEYPGGKGEFLLVYPVWRTIYHLVYSTI